MQLVHAEEPRTEEVPAGQVRQLDEPVTPWYWPAGQWTQTEAWAREKVPTQQLMHAVSPDADAYWPEGHSVQLVADETDDSYLPAAHALHIDLPVADWNLPSAQSVQTVAPAAEYLPATQFWHAERSVAAEVAR